MTHDYESENINEDPRMIAFFDSLLLHDQNHSSGTDSSDENDGMTARLRSVVIHMLEFVTNFGVSVFWSDGVKQVYIDTTA